MEQEEFIWWNYGKRYTCGTEIERVIRELSN